MVKFSFVVAVYNGEKYIEKCVNSILLLDRDDYEIIIINDGSTDNTEDILDKMCSKTNVRSISIKNSGLSVARNVGIENAAGDYIIFIDSDDWIDNKIDRAMSLAYKNDLEVCYFNALHSCEEEDVEEWERPRYPFDEDRDYTGEDILKTYIDQIIDHEAWHGIYKKSFLKEFNIVFLPGVLYEDNAFWFKIMRHANKIRYTNNYCYHYLHRMDSIIHKKIGKHNVISIFAIIEDILSERNYSKDYLQYATQKIIVLTRMCEKNVDTAKLNDLICLIPDMMERKCKLIDRIDDIYNDKDIATLTSKYALISELVSFLGVYDDKMYERVLRLKKLVVYGFKEIMDKWPLKDCSKIIGIYGSGRNADVLLNIYQKIYGEIQAKLYFIDSRTLSGAKKHLNTEVINIADINNYGIDEIIICSVRYENVMYQIVTKMWSMLPVHRVYYDNVFSIEVLFTNNYFEIVDKCNRVYNSKKIFLFETPEYDNIGDHLITIAEKKFLGKNFKDYEIVEVDNTENYEFKARLTRLVDMDDIIVINGGGYFGTLWRERHYNEALDIIRTYKNNTVIVMPQSVYFFDSELGKDYIKMTKLAFDRDNFMICVREHYSYEILKEIGVAEDKILLIPDIALSLDIAEKNNCKHNKEIKTVGFFTRLDKESITPQKCYDDIKKLLESQNIKYNISSMLYGSVILKDMRSKAVIQKITEINDDYDLIITDQLHCMITCVLLQKPCIAFKSISKKTEGVYEWVKDANYIFLVENYSEAVNAIDNLKKLKKENYSCISLGNKWELLKDRILVEI